MLKRFKYTSDSGRLVFESKMTVLFQGFGSSKSASLGLLKEGNSVVDDLKLLWQQRKHQLCVWVPIAILPLVILNSCLILRAPSEFSSNSNSKSFGHLNTTSSSSNSELLHGGNSSSKPGFCDLTQGIWIPDSAPPLYTNETCKHIQLLQNCMRNGKPTETGYLNWRWKPHQCELPRFDPALFLQLMRSKKLLFFGDSLARNHMQSLLCSLAQVEDPQKAYSREDKDVKWFFQAYNFTLAIVWSPFLVKHVKVRDDPLLFNLHLDVPHPSWSSALAEYDFAIFSASQWFFRPSIYSRNNTVVGCNEYSGQNFTAVYFIDAFQAALQTTLSSISRAEGYKGISFLRTASVEHFEHGTWSTGGTCNRTSPVVQSADQLPWLPRSLKKIQVDEYEKFVREGSGNGSKLKILNVTYSAFQRPDGHPGPFRIFQPFANQKKHVQNDCLHWCLPGPVDMWNQLLLESIKNEN